MRAISVALAAVPLAACMTTPDAPEPPTRTDGGACDAEAVQDYVEQEASAASGDAILERSGARTLRWGPPNSAWTMDYQPDRVNVRYDETRTITEITCG